MAGFLRAEASGGFALLIASVAALLWVNLGSPAGYESLWETKLRIGVGELAIEADLRAWVNDALMTIFFFLITLEIKRELVVGELRERRAAALPVFAAAGGVLLPIAIYLLIAGGTDAGHGWGIPMATDAAFAIAAVSVLGTRVGVGVKILLVSIAVIDDVAAIAVIAIAYAGDVEPLWLAAAAAGLGGVVLLRRLGAERIWPYVLLGIPIWIAMHESGVHATIAGVALALLTPARPLNGRPVLEQLEERIHPFSSFLVLPLFALANAGVEIGGGALGEGDGLRTAVAVASGLFLGKLVGIGAATSLAVRLRAGKLPTGVDRRGVAGIAALGGIGFTVSLFITSLAFTEPALTDAAKLGILGGSILSAALGVAILAPGGTHPSREGR